MTINDLAFLKYPDIVEKKRNYYYNFFLKNAVEKAHFIIAISESTKRDILHYFNFPEDKIKVIYDGVGKEFKSIERDEIQGKKILIPKHSGQDDIVGAQDDSLEGKGDGLVNHDGSCPYIPIRDWILYRV